MWGGGSTDTLSLPSPYDKKSCMKSWKGFVWSPKHYEDSIEPRGVLKNTRHSSNLPKQQLTTLDRTMSCMHIMATAIDNESYMYKPVVV